jgi:hypothetical protein
MKTIFTLLTTILISSFIFIKIGISYSFSDLKNYFDTLQAISAMVFTIMGIWIAFVYPNALHRLMDPDKIEVADFSASKGETKRLESLVRTVIDSAIVIIAILFFYAIKLALHKSEIYGSNTEIIKSTALATALSLGILQAKSVAFMISSNIMFLNDLHNKREEREADEDI